MVATAVAYDEGPIPSAIRAAKASVWTCRNAAACWRSARGLIRREGSKVALLSFGGRMSECLKAADELDAAGLSTTVADARFAKPLDMDLIRRLAREHEVLVTVEEGSERRFRQPCSHTAGRRGPARQRPERSARLHLPDVYLDQDKPDVMYARAGLNCDGIMRTCISRPSAPNR